MSENSRDGIIGGLTAAIGVLLFFLMLVSNTCSSLEGRLVQHMGIIYLTPLVIWA